MWFSLWWWWMMLIMRITHEGAKSQELHSSKVEKPWEVLGTRARYQQLGWDMGCYFGTVKIESKCTMDNSSYWGYRCSVSQKIMCHTQITELATFSTRHSCCPRRSSTSLVIAGFVLNTKYFGGTCVSQLSNLIYENWQGYALDLLG